MKKTKQLALALALAATMGTAWARSAPLVEPERVLLPSAEGQSRGAQAVRAAIVAGSESLGWTVVSDEPGKLRLKYNKQGKHEAVIDAVYDADGYQLRYVDSVNLNYRPTGEAPRFGAARGYADPAPASPAETGPQIHPNYNRWIANLIKTIRLAAR